jgi:ABC-type uncharacterized transport system involved in gliding motility auxiliary subunit
MKSKNFRTYLYSAAGVAIMFVALLAFYVVSGTCKQRVDLTADKAYTLSSGTRTILGKLNKKVTLRFFCSQGNLMPAVLRPYVGRVEDLLGEYKQAGNGRVIVEKIDPTPDSDAEDMARLNGVEGIPVPGFGEDRIYLSLVVSVLNDKIVIPLDPAQEKLLEYNISRSIARIVNPTPPVVGVMSPMPVFGGSANPMMMMQRQAPQDAWVFISELKKDFTVKEVPMNSTKIEDDIKVLVVINPRDITETTQYAIDQFILRGGRLLALLDPHAFFDQKQDQMAQVLGDSSGQSSLDRLLKAWGVEMDVSKVVADMNFAIPNGGNSLPTVLGVTRAGINEDDAIGAQIDNIVLPFAGSFSGKPTNGLTQTILIHSSTNAQPVDSTLAKVGVQQIAKDFHATGASYPLAIRLTGKFKTAFPNGKPETKTADKDKDKDKDANKPAAEEKALKEATAEGAVVLMGDSDLINDAVSVQVQNFMGYKLVTMRNGNLNFIQSLVEQLSGDSSLISLRSRAALNRPFTRVREMQAAAEQKYRERIKNLEAKRAEAREKIQQLQANRKDKQQKYIVTPEQQATIDKYNQEEAATTKDLRKVNKDLNKDVARLQNWTKVLNIGLMPLLVAVAGLVLAFVNNKKTAAK